MVEVECTTHRWKTSLSLSACGLTIDEIAIAIICNIDNAEFYKNSGACYQASK